MSEPVELKKCPACGRDMKHSEEYAGIWECSHDGSMIIERFIALPEGTEPGDGPWDIMQRVNFSSIIPERGGGDE